MFFYTINTIHIFIYKQTIVRHLRLLYMCTVTYVCLKGETVRIYKGKTRIKNKIRRVLNIINKRRNKMKKRSYNQMNWWNWNNLNTFRNNIEMPCHMCSALVCLLVYFDLLCYAKVYQVFSFILFFIIYCFIIYRGFIFYPI